MVVCTGGGMLAYPPVRLGATEVLIVDVDRCEDTLAGPYGTSAATWPGQLRVDLAQLAATAVVSDALKGEVCLIRGYGGKLDLQSLRRLVVAHGVGCVVGQGILAALNPLTFRVFVSSEPFPMTLPGKPLVPLVNGFVLVLKHVRDRPRVVEET